MAKGARRKPPSRVRYEQNHPTVSCRVSRDIYERLQAAKTFEGKSFTDILKAGLGIFEAQANKAEEYFSQGYDHGYSEAAEKFKVTYPCLICGRPIAITSAEGKSAVSKYMQDAGWGHSECHKRR